MPAGNDIDRFLAGSGQHAPLQREDRRQRPRKPGVAAAPDADAAAPDFLNGAAL